MGPGYTTLVQDLATGDSSKKPLRLELRRGTTVRGRLRLADGSPCGGSLVAIGEEEWFSYRFATADDQGRFEIPCVKPGAVRVIADARSFLHLEERSEPWSRSFLGTVKVGAPVCFKFLAIKE